jgi:hypothetical protein
MREGDTLGRLKSAGDHAHHIVESTRTLAKRAQDILRLAKIDINSSENGVWLDPLTHYGTYNPAYTQAINDAIEQAYASGGSQAVKAALKAIARGLISGTFP